MNKCLVMALVAAIGLVSCSVKDEQYYFSHPKELQQALKSCPAQKPQGISCEKLKHIGERMNNLAYQLQSNPQGFGSKILALQETIAKQEMESKRAPEINASLTQNKHDLASYLAIVKWLESPES